MTSGHQVTKNCLQIDYLVWRNKQKKHYIFTNDTKRTESSNLRSCRRLVFLPDKWLTFHWLSKYLSISFRVTDQSIDRVIFSALLSKQELWWWGPGAERQRLAERNDWLNKEPNCVERWRGAAHCWGCRYWFVNASNCLSSSVALCLRRKQKCRI